MQATRGGVEGAPGPTATGRAATGDKDPATTRRSSDREHSFDDDVRGLDGVRDGDSVRRVNLNAR
jgi:hypothetical protein